jgi:hypothetical protein
MLGRAFEVGTHIAPGRLNFSHKFCPTIHDCNQVFQVTATRAIIPSSVTKSFQFRRTKIYRADHQDPEAWLQLTFLRPLYFSTTFTAAFLIPKSICMPTAFDGEMR